jgi:cell division transport system permease protein
VRKAFDMSSEIPLTKDPSTRYVPWVIGLLMYLAILATFSYCILQGMIGFWALGSTQSYTIEIPAQIKVDASDSLEMERRESHEMEYIAAVLAKTPGIKSVEVLPREESLALLEPWLGSGTFLKDLPIPKLIDIKVVSNLKFNMAQLSATLERINPHIRLIDHRAWHQSVASSSTILETTLLFIIGFIVISILGTIAFTTQTSLLMHRSIIEILSLIGASDNYIAQQFQRYALSMGIRGSIIGFILLVLTVISWLWFFDWDKGASFFNIISPQISWLWLLIGIVPFIIILLMMFSAHKTTKSTLEKAF